MLRQTPKICSVCFVPCSGENALNCEPRSCFKLIIKIERSEWRSHSSLNKPKVTSHLHSLAQDLQGLVFEKEKNE